MGDKPCSLTQVIEYQHQLDKQPTDSDIPPSAVSEIGIQGFGTGGTEEHRTENEKPFGRRNQQPDGIIGIESPDDVRMERDVAQPHRTEKEELHQHHRPEITTYPVGAELLNEEKCGDDGNCNGNDGHGRIDRL